MVVAHETVVVVPPVDVVDFADVADEDAMVVVVVEEAPVDSPVDDCVAVVEGCDPVETTVEVDVPVVVDIALEEVVVLLFEFEPAEITR